MASLAHYLRRLLARKATWNVACNTTFLRDFRMYRSWNVKMCNKNERQRRETELTSIAFDIPHTGNNSCARYIVPPSFVPFEIPSFHMPCNYSQLEAVVPKFFEEETNKKINISFEVTIQRKSVGFYYHDYFVALSAEAIVRNLINHIRLDNNHSHVKMVLFWFIPANQRCETCFLLFSSFFYFFLYYINSAHVRTSCNTRSKYPWYSTQKKIILNQIKPNFLFDFILTSLQDVFRFVNIFNIYFVSDMNKTLLSTLSFSNTYC